MALIHCGILGPETTRGSMSPTDVTQHSRARTDRKGIVGNGEHERCRQEKEARAGWVIRQIQIGVVV